MQELLLIVLPKNEADQDLIQFQTSFKTRKFQTSNCSTKIQNRLQESYKLHFNVIKTFAEHLDDTFPLPRSPKARPQNF